MGRCASFLPPSFLPSFLPSCPCLPIVSVFTFGRALKKDVELHSKVGRANRTGGRGGGRVRRRTVARPKGSWMEARARAIRPSFVRPAVPAVAVRANVGPKRGKGGREGLFISAPRRPTSPGSFKDQYQLFLSSPSFLPRVELLVALKSPCRRCCCLPALSVGTAFAGKARARDKTAFTFGRSRKPRPYRSTEPRTTSLSLRQRARGRASLFLSLSPRLCFAWPQSFPLILPLFLFPSNLSRPADRPTATDRDPSTPRRPRFGE